MRKKYLKVECTEVGCEAVLEAHRCRSVIPKEVFDRWENNHAPSYSVQETCTDEENGKDDRAKHEKD